MIYPNATLLKILYLWFNIPMKVDDIFSSKGRVAILVQLAIKGKLYVSELARYSKISVESVRAHLKKLEDLQIVRYKAVGNKKVYMLNKQNPYAREIEDLILKWYRRKN